MTDEELREQAPGLPVLYFDGYGNFQKINGVLRCVGWTIGIGGQYNIISSLAGADIGCREAQRVMAMAIDLRAQALDTLKRPSPEQQLMEKKGNDSDHTDV